MSDFAVLAIGRDNKGVVAALTSTIRACELNIETSHMTTLGNRFSMMLVVRGEIADCRALEVLLKKAHPSPDARTEMKVSVEPLSQYDRSAPTPPSHVITVYTVEAPGVISGLSSKLRDEDVNITHLHSQVVPVRHNAGPPRDYCVTRAFVNGTKPIDQEDLEDRLRAALDLPGESKDGDVRVETVDAPPAPPAA